MLTVRVPVAFRNKCERVRSICPGVNATRTSGTGLERDRNANRNRCERGLIELEATQTNLPMDKTLILGGDFN